MTGAPRAARPVALPGAGSRLGEGDGVSRADPSGAREPPEPGSGSTKPRGTARDRALRLLAVRDRSRRELERRLVAAGFDREEVAETLEGLSAVGLVDDERFARALAEHALTVRRSGERAATRALLARGVPREVAEQAIAAVGGDDDARAEALARERAPRLAGLEPHAAFRRLLGFLVRRGHDPEVARRAAAGALQGKPDEPPEQP